MSSESNETLELRFVMELVVHIDPALEVGTTPHGFRRVIPISGGTFEGPDIRGVVVPGGADWNIRRTDDVAEVWARYTLQTDDGVLISITNAGLSRGAHGTPERYARTVPSFEVSDEKYAWLQRSVFVGKLERHDGPVPAVKLRFYEVR